MTIFEYRAKNDQGKTVKGKIEAHSQDQAVKILRNKNLVVIKLKESSSLKFVDSITSTFKKTNLTELVTFTRQLSTMISSGLPLTESLIILQAQSKPNFGKIIGEVLRDVQGGVSFAKALSPHEIFPKVYIALIKAGEVGGIMDKILNRLADNLEQKQEFIQKTKGALIYPIIVVIGMLIVAFIMLVTVIPKLTSIFDDFGAELPLPTRMLVSISDFLSSYWYLFIILTSVFLYFFKLWKKTDSGRFIYDKIILRLPIAGSLNIKIILAEFTRTLSLLIGSGVSILEALNIVADALGNAVLESHINEASSEVEKGGTLAETLSKREVFPPILSQMVLVGEETGKLDKVLLKVSRYFETEAEQAIKNLTTAMEPLIMILLGIGVGFMIVSIIMPIYNLTSQF